MESVHAQPIPMLKTPEADAHAPFTRLREYLNQRVLGQPALVERLLVALLADGHLLVEGAPGLAKVQSALLEAMGEGQVTVGRESYPLPDLFLVMATQNPIEQEGTYPLPEAQLDRFLMYVKVDYPDASVERKVLHLAREQSRRRAVTSFQRVIKHEIFRARDEVLDIHVAPALEEYLTQLVLATRDPSPYSEEIARWVEWGASPRGTIALDRCSRAHAWLNGRSYATPEDVHAVAADTLRHRVLLSYEAHSEGITSDDVIGTLIALVPLP